MDRACMGLKKVQCEIWNGLIFVNLDLEAQSLKEVLDPIQNRILPYDDMDELKFNDGYSYII